VAETDTITPPPSPLRDAYDFVTGDEDARVCRDIPASACRHQPRNFFLHLVALALTKSGDLLASAKVVLPWLLAGMGAPAHLAGLLVPVRESLALLPQLAVAGWMRRAPVRKWFWIAGSIGQALCLLAIVATAVTLSGAGGGWLVVVWLALFSLARGVCSVAAKDVLGKTVSKTRRGTVSGYAASAAGIAAAALGVGLLLQPGAFIQAAAVLVGLASALWLLAALAYAGIAESPGATEGGGNALDRAWQSLDLLRRDVRLRRFIATRALLVSTALAAPFFVLLLQGHGGGVGGLGALLLASGLASAGSASVWGRMADRSSRRVLASAGALGGVSGLAVAALTAVPLGGAGATAAFAGCYLLLGVAHSGVRIGRKTHLVDMADAGSRSDYVALSNTVIGAWLLIVGALISAVAAWLGAVGAILALSVIAFGGVTSALRLDEVQ